jgi:hypothetical protein
MEDRETLKKQLDALKLFPNNNLVRQLRSQIKQKLESLEKQRDRIPEVPEDKVQTRSVALKKYHRYIRLIRDNFPHYSYLEIRREFAKRRKNKESNIPDAVWQNPSP